MSEQDESQAVPSATVPGAKVEPHGGQRPAEERANGPYNDGNLDARGVSPVDGPVVDPTGEPDSLDDDLDTSPRTDGRGGSPDVGQTDEHA